jgi:hypothetical protein
MDDYVETLFVKKFCVFSRDNFFDYTFNPKPSTRLNPQPSIKNLVKIKFFLWAM